MILEEIKKVLELAKYYPSGDNVQPFDFKFSTESGHLDVFYSYKRGKHAIITDDHVPTITLAAALEYLNLSAAIFGYTIQLEMLDYENQNWENSPHLARVSFRKQSGQASISEVDLRSRYTDRGAFHSPDNMAAIFQKLQLNFQHCQVRLLESPQKEELRFIASHELGPLRNPEILRDIGQRVSIRQEKPNYGLYWKNLGIQFFETIPLVIAGKGGFWASTVTKTTPLAMVQNNFIKLYSGSSFIFVYSKPGANLVDTCRELIRFCIEAAKEGFVFQPCTITMERLRADKNIEVYSQKYNFPEAKKVSIPDRILEFGDPNQCVWVLRGGKALNPLPERAKTGRAPLADIFTYS